MKRGNKSGAQPQKQGSSSRRDSSTRAGQASEETGQLSILSPRLVSQKRPLRGWSRIAGVSGGSTRNAKRPKLLPDVYSADQDSETDDSADNDRNEAERNNDASDDDTSDNDDEIDSDASESRNEDSASEETAGNPAAERNFKTELSSMSFEELLQLRNKVGTKAYQQMTTGERAPKATATKKRPCADKHRPLEISNKKPVPFLRQVIPVKKKVPRDPRFDNLSGEYSPEVFEKTYRFLNDIRKKEKELVQKQLKKTRNVEQQSKLHQLLKRMTQQEDAQMRRQKERDKDLAFKMQQRELAKQGKKPFYLKKSQKQKLELAGKYKELKKSGKLESFLSKKRKRNAAKDKRRLPFKKRT